MSGMASASSRSAGLVLGTVLNALEAVVAVESLLVSVGQVAILVQVRGVLDAVLSEGQVQLAVLQGVAAQRDDGVAATEQAVVDGDEVRLAGGVVNVNVLYATNLVAINVVCSCVCKVFNAVVVSHVGVFSLSGLSKSNNHQRSHGSLRLHRRTPTAHRSIERLRAHVTEMVNMSRHKRLPAQTCRCALAGN